MTIFNNEGVAAAIGDGPGRHGLYGYYYKVDDVIADYPDFGVIPTAQRIDTDFNINSDGETDIFPPNEMTIHYGVRWKGYILLDPGLFGLIETEDELFDLAYENDDLIALESGGDASFLITSDDGSRLYIDDELIISNDGVHVTNDASGTVGLTEDDLRSVEIWYFQNEGGAVFQLWNGEKTEIISPDVLYTNPVLDENVEHRPAGVAKAIGGGDSIVTHIEGPTSQIISACHHHAVLFIQSRDGAYVPTITRCIQRLTNQKLKFISNRNDHR